MTERTETRVHVRPDVVFRVLGPGAVLVNLADNHVFELNETGAAAWAKLADGMAAHDVAEFLTSRFEVDVPEALARVEELILDLRRASLIE